MRSLCSQLFSACHLGDAFGYTGDMRLVVQVDSHGLSENPDDYKNGNGSGKAPALPSDDSVVKACPSHPPLSMCNMA